MAEIILGTVRFGISDYGINNKRGAIPRTEVFEIMDLARRSGIDTLDTAEIYGNSEEIIGDYIRSKKPALKVISKYSAKSGKDVDASFEVSRKKIGLDKLHGYLIHDFNDYSKDPGIWDKFRRLKDSGKAEKIGFSLYYPDELKTIMDKKIKFDIVQVPYNILDRRFEEYFDRLKEIGTEIHVRSVFLQGLLFKKPTELSGIFLSIKDKIASLSDISKRTGAPLSSLCINFAAFNKKIDKLVIGVEGMKDFKEDLEALKSIDKVGTIYEELAGLKESNERIILPVNWGK